MKIIATTTWERRTGYLGSALSGQLTKLELPDIGVVYVRENFRLHDTFVMGSGARLGVAGGVNGTTGEVWPGINPKKSSLGKSILELCAPALHFEAAAAIVAKADSLHRPVLANRTFTAAWAELALCHGWKPIKRPLAGSGSRQRPKP